MRHTENENKVADTNLTIVIFVSDEIRPVKKGPIRVLATEGTNTRQVSVTEDDNSSTDIPHCVLLYCASPMLHFFTKGRQYPLAAKRLWLAYCGGLELNL